MSIQQYNQKNPTIKRILKEIKEMSAENSPYFTANPLEDNIFEWHFTIRGPGDSHFEGGIFHGKINLPLDYPFKPPNIQLLTPNGRFEVGTKICLTISAHHPETWQPSWSKGRGAIGALDYPEKERRKLSAKSVSWKCPECGSANATALPEPEPSVSAAASGDQGGTGGPGDGSGSGSGASRGPLVDPQAAAALLAMQAFAAEQSEAQSTKASEKPRLQTEPEQAPKTDGDAGASPNAYSRTAAASGPALGAGAAATGLLQRRTPTTTAAAAAGVAAPQPVTAASPPAAAAIKPSAKKRRQQRHRANFVGILIMILMFILGALVFRKVLLL